MASLSCSSGAYTIVGAASVAAWVLSLAAGSYAVTGTAIGTLHGHPITAVSGVYTLTGTAIQSRRIAIEPAGYILNGTAVTLTKSNKFVFASASGTYNITGTTTLVERGIPYTKGTYALTGTIVNLTRSSAAFRIPIAAGSYGLTGTSVSLLSTVTIDSGDYQLSGTVVTFRNGKSLPISSGSYNITGTTSTRLEQSRHFPSSSGTYGITGAVTTLRYSGATAIFLVLNNTSYVINGSTVNLLMARRLITDSGVYGISDGHTVFKKQFESGLYNLVGSPVTLVIGNRTLTPSSGSYSITGGVTSLVYSIHRLVLDSGVYLLASPVTTINNAFLLVNAQGAYTLTGLPTTLRATQIQAEPGVYTITDTGTSLRASRVGRWRTQSKVPASTTKQPQSTSTWDPEQSPPGV